MATSKTPQQEALPIRVVDRLSEAFDRAQQCIREQAYLIFQGRDPEQGDSVSDWLEAQQRVLTPVELTLKEQKKNLVVEGSLKGYSPQDIEIDVCGDELRVFGAHAESTGSVEAGESIYERDYFYQSLQLPCAVAADQCTARLFKNGKLRITLPRA